MIFFQYFFSFLRSLLEWQERTTKQERISAFSTNFTRYPRLRKLRKLYFQAKPEKKKGKGTLQPLTPSLFFREAMTALMADTNSAFNGDNK